MTIINGKMLTTFEVASDGSTISINVTDQNSRPGSLVLPAECLRQMMMTLPEMAQQALERRYRDPSLRITYPVSSWRLEASTDSSKLILTLSTDDGFSVSFAVVGDQLAAMAQSAHGADQVKAPLPS
jgi:hypothetical protein